MYTQSERKMSYNKTKGYDFMKDYKESYLYLFNRITDLMEEMKLIQQEAEEKYISSGELNVIPFPTKKEKEDTGR